MTLKNTDVTLTLTTVQRADEIDKFTVTHKATLTKKNDSYYITYDDGEPNIITVKQNEVRITKPRSQSALTFEQNREHVSNYVTPVGKMSVSVFTHKLLNEFETLGRVFIKYRLDFGGSAITENDITIKIQENKK